MSAFQTNKTEKMKMKWENICTTLHGGDGGSASLSLLHQWLGDRELGQKRLERGCKGSSRKDKRISQIRVSLSYTPPKEQR